MKKSFNNVRVHGGAVVEFALILTLLITIMAGIFEFGRAFWYYGTLTKATRDAARLMSVSARATVLSQGVPAAKAIIVNVASEAGLPGFSTTNVDVVCLDASFNNSFCVDGTAPGGVRVQIVGYTMTIGQFIPFLIGASRNYAATLSPHTTMRYML
jgi:Flp pilus assembly protein TadG